MMGTNYYAVRVKPTVDCDKCCIHIGKSSYGWRFLFHDCSLFHTYPQVVEFLKKKVIKKKEYVLLDEYDRQTSVKDFLALVQDKQQTANSEDFDHGVRNIDGYRFCDTDFD